MSRNGLRVLFMLLMPGLTIPAFGAWSYSRSITVDHTQAGTADSSSYPVTVILSNGGVGYTVGTTLKVAGSGGHIQHTVTQSGGSGGTIPADLVFGTTSNCSSLIPWEVEFYDGTAGLFIAHVKVSTLSHTSDTVFYMCYGDASVTTQQNVSGNSPANVWDSSFKGVWHMTDGTTLSMVDSTTNANNATIVNGTATAGLIDGALNNTAVANDGGTLAGFVSSATMTFSAWVKSTDVSHENMIGGQQPSGTFSLDNFQMCLACDGAGHPRFLIFNGGSVQLIAATATPSNAVWYYVVGSYDGTNLNLYVNNTKYTTAPSVTMNTNSDQLMFANITGGLYGFLGALDEFRYSSGARSDSWLTSDYNNQKPSSNFLAIGAESGGSVAYTPAAFDRMGVPYDFDSALGAHYPTSFERRASLDLVTSLGAHFPTAFDMRTLAEVLSVLGAHFTTGLDAGRSYDSYAALGNHFSTGLDHGSALDINSVLGSHYPTAFEASRSYDLGTTLGSHFVSGLQVGGSYDLAAKLGTHFASAYDLGMVYDLGSKSAGLHASAFDYTAMSDYVAKLGGRAVFGLEYGQSSFSTTANQIGYTKSPIEMLGSLDLVSRLATYGRSAIESLYVNDFMGRGISINAFETGSGSNLPSVLGAHSATAFDLTGGIQFGSALAHHTVVYADGGVVYDSGNTTAAHNVVTLEVLRAIDLNTIMGHSSFFVVTNDVVVGANIGVATKTVFAPILSSDHVLIYRPQVTIVVVK